MTSVPEATCPWKSCKSASCRKPWHDPYYLSQYGFMEKLKPVILWVGISEIIIGCVLVFFVVYYAVEVDSLYEKKDSKIISFLSFGGLIMLSVSGMVLVASIILNKRGAMWFYVLLSTFLCIYIFVLSVVLIHISLMLLDKEPIKSDVEKSIFFNKPSVIGILTLFGSVFHFIGTISVFTYYNLKYVHPTMFANYPIS